MRSSTLILSLLGIASVNVVYGQTPCTHNNKVEDSKPAANELNLEYIPAPVGQPQELDLSYLPPPDNQIVPQANQEKPVYVAPPEPKKETPAPPTPKPITQATYVKPVYQPLPKLQSLPSTVQPVTVPKPLPKLQPLPQATYVRPVVQPLPKLQPLPQATYVRPVVQPLPKLQPLPQATYVRPVVQTLPQATYVRPAAQPLPKLQPLPQPTYVQPAVQPLPKLQPLPQITNVRPVYQPLKPIVVQPALSLRPLPTLPKIAVTPSPRPIYSTPAPLKPIVPVAPKQSAPPKISYQPRDNVVQATNIQQKIAKPDLEPAAQNNIFNFARPSNIGDIKIHHYICDIGNAEQKFLCDIYRLWDLHHPKDVNGNELDYPGDNSNYNPAYATIPSSPRPTYTPSTTTPRPYTFAPLPSSPRPVSYAPLPPTPRPVSYAPLPPSPSPVTFAPRPITTTTTTPAPIYYEQDDLQQPTTVNIPKKTAPVDNNLGEETPDDTETVQYASPPSTSYPTTTTTTTPQPSPSPSSPIPAKEGYDYPKPSVPFPAPQKDGYDYPKPAVPFSDGAPLPKQANEISSVPVSSLSGPSSLVSQPSLSFDAGSSLSSFADRLNQYPFGYSFSSFADGLVYQSPGAPTVSTTVSPDIFLNSNGESVRYSYQPLQQSVTTLSPLSYPTASYSTDASLSTISPSAPTSVVQYSSKPVDSSATLAPLLLSKESLALSFGSTPPPSQSLSYSTSDEKINDISTEKPILPSTTVSPLPGGYNSQPLGQFYRPFGYSFGPNEPAVTTFSPLSYSFEPSLSLANNNITRASLDSITGQSIQSSVPVSYFNYQPIQPQLGPISYNYQPIQPQSGPISYSYQPIQPLDQTFYSGQSFPGPNIDFRFAPSTPPPFAFQSSTPEQQTQQNSQQSTSAPSQLSYQSGNALSDSIPGQISSYAKSGLSFGSNVQSVENLKDLQSTARALNEDLRLAQGNNQFSSFSRSESNGASKKANSEEKEDISLGNIEILKVKRKSK